MTARAERERRAAASVPTAATVWAVHKILHTLKLWTSVKGDMLSPAPHGQASAAALSESVQARHRHVLVHVRGGGKTKMMECEAERTVGAMREAMGVPLDAVILLVPGGRELDDEMRVGEIVREGPKCDVWARMKRWEGRLKEATSTTSTRSDVGGEGQRQR